MYAKPVLFVNIMLSVQVAGVMWRTWLSLGRAMTGYDAATSLIDGEHMISNLATVMVGVNDRRCRGPTGHRPSPAARPIDDGRLDIGGRPGADGGRAGGDASRRGAHRQPDPDLDGGHPPADWMDIRARWASFQTLRTFLSLASAAAAVAAAPAPSAANAVRRDDLHHRLSIYRQNCPMGGMSSGQPNTSLAQGRTHGIRRGSSRHAADPLEFPASISRRGDPMTICVRMSELIRGQRGVTVAAALLAPVLTATTARRPRRRVLLAWPSTSCAGGDVTGRTGVWL
jgi:hypothetical protein